MGRSLNDNRSLCEALVFVGDLAWPAGCHVKTAARHRTASRHVHPPWVPPPVCPMGWTSHAARFEPRFGSPSRPVHVLRVMRPSPVPLVSLGTTVPTASPNSATRTHVAGASPSGKDAQGLPSRAVRNFGVPADVPREGRVYAVHGRSARRGFKRLQVNPQVNARQPGPPPRGALHGPRPMWRRHHSRQSTAVPEG